MTYRLCVRAADLPCPPPATAAPAWCSRCMTRVWMDASQRIPAAFGTLTIVCTRCLTVHPDLAALAPGDVDQARRLHQLADARR